MLLLILLLSRGICKFVCHAPCGDANYKNSENIVTLFN